VRDETFDSIAWLLVETAPDGMVVVDVEGTIVLVNAQAERLFGYSRADLVGRPIEILVPEPLRERHPDLRKEFAYSPTPRPVAGLQLSGRRKGGSVFPAEISLAALDVDGETLVSATIRDVTSRQAEAESRREADRARERDRLQVRLDRARRMESLGQLAGGVAHDFNNILAVILNYASFVEDEIANAEAAPGGGHWTAAHRDIVEVRNAAERATLLTRQLLAFARRDVSRPQVVDLAKVLGELESMLKRTLGERVSLVIRPDMCAPAVRIDPTQLEQVLLNLVVNARDAMPSGGQLVIATSRLDADESYANGRPDVRAGVRYLSLRVSDTGTGIPPDVVDRIFEPFFSTKAEAKGTGLGLATVYGVVTQAGGSIEVYSDLGRGTTFTILLPAAEAAHTEVESETAAPPRPAAGTTVLVVDDDRGVRDVSRRVLLDAGYEVLIANDGDEALAILTTYEGHIHLLLSDMVMPGLQGHELAAAAARLRPTTKVVLMSGYAEPLAGGELDPGLRLLDKPFTRTTLLDAVHDAERA
jgi:PAS domain S-box-containing protein